jgi:hypothetical protein
LSRHHLNRPPPNLHRPNLHRRGVRQSGSCGSRTGSGMSSSASGPSWIPPRPGSSEGASAREDGSSWPKASPRSWSRWRGPYGRFGHWREFSAVRKERGHGPTRISPANFPSAFDNSWMSAAGRGGWSGHSRATPFGVGSCDGRNTPRRGTSGVRDASTNVPTPGSTTDSEPLHRL